jgi:hypothetical protein
LIGKIPVKGRLLFQFLNVLELFLFLNFPNFGELNMLVANFEKAKFHFLQIKTLIFVSALNYSFVRFENLAVSSLGRLQNLLD